MVQLGVEVAAEHVQPGAAVAGQLAAADDLGHRARGLPPPQLELEEAVPGRGVSLREEQVRFVPGVDVVDAPAVTPDLHRLGQPGYRQGRHRPLPPRPRGRPADHQQRHHRPEQRPVSHGVLPPSLALNWGASFGGQAR